MRRQEVAFGCEHPEHPERGRFKAEPNPDPVVTVNELLGT